MTALHAFVIMPFDSEFDAVYTDLICPPLQEAGFEVHRADDVTDRQNVLIDVVRGIAEADLIIADLTASNPNVFYELGLAHALGVPTVLMAHSGSAEDIPFDLRQYRTEFYDTHFQRARTIVEALEKIGRAHAAGNLSFSSPISDFLPGEPPPAVHSKRRVRSHASEAKEPAAPRGETPSEKPETKEEDDGAEEGESEEERGIFDFLDEMGSASTALVDALEPVSTATDRVGTEIEALSERMNALDPTAPNGQAKGKRLLLESAHVLDRYAQDLEDREQEFEDAVEALTASGLGYLTLLSEQPAHFEDDLRAALSTSRELRDSVTGAAAGISEFRRSIAELPPMIKQTNRARNRAVRALDSYLAQYDRVRSYAEQSIGLMETALEESDSRS